MAASDSALMEADEIWGEYEIPDNVTVEGSRGWEDDSQGELVRRVFLRFDDQAADEPSVAAHFVVAYHPSSGHLREGEDAELRITATGAVIGTPGVRATAPTL